MELHKTDGSEVAVELPAIQLQHAWKLNDLHKIIEQNSGMKNVFAHSTILICLKMCSKMINLRDKSRILYLQILKSFVDRSSV